MFWSHSKFQDLEKIMTDLISVAQDAAFDQLMDGKGPKKQKDWDAAAAAKGKGGGKGAGKGGAGRGKGGNGGKPGGGKNGGKKGAGKGTPVVAPAAGQVRLGLA